MSSDLPISSPYRSTPDVPVSDAEREQVNSRLNAAFESGSIDPDEYQQRLDALFGARRLGELVPVVTGLPPLATYSDPAIVASGSGRPGELAPSRNSTRVALAVVAIVVAMLMVLGVMLGVVLF